GRGRLVLRRAPVRGALGRQVAPGPRGAAGGAPPLAPGGHLQRPAGARRPAKGVVRGGGGAGPRPRPGRGARQDAGRDVPRPGVADGAVPVSAASPLETLAKMAEVLDSKDYADAVSPSLARVFRDMADRLDEGLRSSGLNVDAQTLLAFTVGMTVQREMQEQQAKRQLLAILAGSKLGGLGDSAP